MIKDMIFKLKSNHNQVNQPQIRVQSIINRKLKIVAWFFGIMIVLDIVNIFIKLIILYSTHKP